MWGRGRRCAATTRTRQSVQLIDLEKRVSADHPCGDPAASHAALGSLSRDFDALYLPIGRASIPPERFLRALCCRRSIRSAGAATGRADRLRPAVSLVCRARHRGPGLGRHDLHQEPRPAAGRRGGAEVSRRGAVAREGQGLLSSDHFSVDGTLLEAWASPKSFRPKDGRAPRPAPGATARATFTASAARTTRTLRPPMPMPACSARGRARKPGCLHGPCADGESQRPDPDAVTTRASGHAERLAAIALVEPRADRPTPITLGADKAYDTANFVMELREHTVTPHVAQNQAGGVRRSMAAPPGIPATRSPSASANASKRPSAGPRRWPACARCAIAACPRSAGSSPWRWPPQSVRLPKLLAVTAP